MSLKKTPGSLRETPWRYREFPLANGERPSVLDPAEVHEPEARVRRLVPVVVGLERALDRDAEVVGLFLGHFG